MPRAISNCKTCGAAFQFYTTKTSGIFCSKKCQHSFDYPGSVWLGKNGYMYVQKGRKSKILLHRVIAGAAQGQVVHHVDGDKLNNDPSNLSIVRNQTAHLAEHEKEWGHKLVEHRWMKD